MDVVVWLQSLGLGRYEAAFRENEISERILPSLTAQPECSILTRMEPVSTYDRCNPSRRRKCAGPKLKAPPRGPNGGGAFALGGGLRLQALAASAVDGGLPIELLYGSAAPPFVHFSASTLAHTADDATFGEAMLALGIIKGAA
jgi:hypothetical protein